MKVYRDPFENLGEDCSPQGETAMTVRSPESVFMIPCRTSFIAVPRTCLPAGRRPAEP